jgi:hypothetical protein
MCAMESKTLEIQSSVAWYALGSRRLTQTEVVLSNMGDIHPYQNGPVFEETTVRLNRCDKNFVFYWLKPSTFPCVKTIHLNSHPCDPSVLWRWADDGNVTLWLDSSRGD